MLNTKHGLQYLRPHNQTACELLILKEEFGRERLYNSLNYLKKNYSNYGLNLSAAGHRISQADAVGSGNRPHINVAMLQ